MHAGGSARAAVRRSRSSSRASRERSGPRRRLARVRGPRGERRLRVLPAPDQLEQLVEHRPEAGVRVPELDARRERGLGGAAQLLAAGRRELDDRHRAAHRRPATHARVHPRPPREPHRRAHERGVRAPGPLGDDRLFLGGGLVAELQVLEPVADRLGEVAGGDVLRGVLRRHHLEALGRAHRPEVRHLHDALVERRQQQVLRRLRQPVQLVQEEDAALPHRPQQRPGDERVLAVAEPQHQRRVEPAGEPALREAVVAVDAHGAASEAPADGERQRRLARAHRPLEQQVPAAGDRRARGGHLLFASDHGADGSTSARRNRPPDEPSARGRSSQIS